jgi:hypothetical protein
LAKDVAQRTGWEVFARMRNGDMAGLGWMLEFPVITLAANTLPTLGFESLDDVEAPHFVYVYTL